MANSKAVILKEVKFNKAINIDELVYIDMQLKQGKYKTNKITAIENCFESKHFLYTGAEFYIKLLLPNGAEMSATDTNTIPTVDIVFDTRNEWSYECSAPKMLTFYEIFKFSRY